MSLREDAEDDEVVELERAAEAGEQDDPPAGAASRGASGDWLAVATSDMLRWPLSRRGRHFQRQNPAT